jgi:hypothetical protein
MTGYQVERINEISKYHSSCSGVWYATKNKYWGATFRCQSTTIDLGHYSTEEEAIKIYNAYHEKFYQDVLIKLHKIKNYEE